MITPGIKYLNFGSFLVNYPPMFLSKFWYLTHGVPIFRGTIMLCLNIFLLLLCITKWAKLGSYLHIKYLYLGTFLCQLPPPNVFVKMLVADPRGAHIQVYSDGFAINFEEIPSSFALNVFLWLLCINGRNWEVICLITVNTNICGHFWSKFWYLTPRCPYIGIPLLVCN